MESGELEILGCQKNECKVLYQYLNSMFQLTIYLFAPFCSKPSWLQFCIGAAYLSKCIALYINWVRRTANIIVWVAIINIELSVDLSSFLLASLLPPYMLNCTEQTKGEGGLRKSEVCPKLSSYPVPGHSDLIPGWKNFLFSFNSIALIQQLLWIPNPRHWRWSWIQSYIHLSINFTD